MGHRKPFAKFLQGFTLGPCRWDLLQNCLADTGILDTEAPHSLQACPSSRVAPWKTQLQFCEASQQLGWAVNSRYCFSLLLETRRDEVIHAGCGKTMGALALLKPTLGGTRGCSLLTLGRSRENCFPEQSRKHAPSWAAVLFDLRGQVSSLGTCMCPHGLSTSLGSHATPLRGLDNGTASMERPRFVKHFDV